MRPTRSAPREQDIVGYLDERPGFMIRRAHQIATSVFVDMCRDSELTPSQYGALYVLEHRGPSDQTAIARLVGLDRSTTGLVIRGLVRRGLVDKRPSAADRRASALTLSARGRAVLKKCEPQAAAAKKALLVAFTPAERREFLRLLKKFTTANNHMSRARVDPRPRQADPSAP